MTASDLFFIRETLTCLFNQLVLPFCCGLFWTVFNDRAKADDINSNLCRKYVTQNVFLVVRHKRNSRTCTVGLVHVCTECTNTHKMQGLELFFFYNVVSCMRHCKIQDVSAMVKDINLANAYIKKQRKTQKRRGSPHKTLFIPLRCFLLCFCVNMH